MLTFDAGTHHFNLRAAAIILNESRVLLHKIEGDDFWSFPGGRVNAGELASVAVVREMHEELAEPVTCGELIWVVENFFTYRGVGHHELGMYFRVNLAPESPLLISPGPYFGAEGSLKLTFDWFERALLDTLNIRPAFVASALTQPELEFRHIVHHDESAP